MPRPADTPARQRGPRTDPDLMDGDSAHGNPGEPAGDEAAPDTDTDTGFGATDAETDADLRDATATEEMVDEEEGDEADDEGEDVEEDDDTSDAEPDEDAGADDDAAEVQAAPPAMPHPANSPSAGAPQADRPPAPPASAHRGDPSGEFPIREYEKLTVPEVVRRATNMERPQLEKVLEFERSHRNRKTLVVRLQRLVGKG